jgi:hypothetical protein
MRKSTNSIPKLTQKLLNLTVGISILFTTGTANANELQSIISGQNTPLSIQLQNLDNSWRKISISGRYEMGDLIKSWSELFGMNSYDNTYYTQGKTITIGNQTYIIAYRIPSSGEAMTLESLLNVFGNSDCDSKTLPPVLTATTSVSLALLNLESMGSLNNIKPVNIQEEINLSQQRHEELKRTCEQAKIDSINQEGKQYIDSINRGQQAHFFEYEKFNSSLEELYLGIGSETENYRYSIKVDRDAVFNYAIAKNPNAISYVGGVFVIKEGENQNTVAIVCRANQPGTSQPPNPILKDNLAVCASGTTEAF